MVQHVLVMCETTLKKDLLATVSLNHILVSQEPKFNLHQPNLRGSYCSLMNDIIIVHYEKLLLFGY